MSAIPNTPSPSARQVPMQVLVAGRIEGSSRYDGKTTSRIICPAPDPYSRPSIVEVRSKSSIGSIGDEVSALGRLGGYARKAQRVTDKDTGEIKTFVPVDMTVDLIE